MIAPERIAAYLKRRSEHRQTDYERIHGLDVGSDKACELLASDIETVIAAIAAARAEGVREGMLKAAEIADAHEKRWNDTAYDRRQNGRDDNFACACASASTHIGIVALGNHLAFRPRVEDPPPASWISKMEGRE